MIPFLEHDDANRALMGANMQRQAVPLVRSDGASGRYPVWSCAPRSTPAMSSSPTRPGVIEEVVRRLHHRDGPTTAPRHTYRMRKFARSNHGTCANQSPIVDAGRPCRGRPGDRRRSLHRKR